jgi:hypothetical protein
MAAVVSAARQDHRVLACERRHERLGWCGEREREREREREVVQEEVRIIARLSPRRPPSGSP